MSVENICKIVTTVASILFTCLIPTVIVMINRIKAVKNAKTEAEKQSAINDMKEYLLKTVVPTVEGIYDKFNDALTSSGKTEKTFSEAKQDSAISKLQSYAISKNYTFDLEYWIKETKDIINVTKSVNATDKAKAEIKAQSIEEK